MAIDKIENPASTACYYNLTKAIQVRDDFRSQSKHAMQVLNTYKTQIESEQTIDAVDTIYQQAIKELWNGNIYYNNNSHYHRSIGNWSTLSQQVPSISEL